MGVYFVKPNSSCKANLIPVFCSLIVSIGLNEEYKKALFDKNGILVMKYKKIYKYMSKATILTIKPEQHPEEMSFIFCSHSLTMFWLFPLLSAHNTSESETL